MADLTKENIQDAALKAVLAKRYRMPDGREVERPALSEISAANKLRKELEQEALEASGELYHGEQVILRRLK